MAKYLSTKTYGNDRGLSCTFRQWRSSHSHCSLIHGYSLGIKLIFESETLDDRNWVMDFGGLKAFKEWSEYMFDHTLVIGEDDPHLDKFQALAALGLNDVGGVCDIAKPAHVQVATICGDIDPEIDGSLLRQANAVSLVAHYGAEISMSRVLHCIEEQATQIVQRLLASS